MKVKCSSSTFKILKMAQRINEDICLKFTKEGVQIKTTDASQMALLETSIPKKDFEQYKVKGEELVGLYLPQFNRILNVLNYEKLDIETKENMLVVKSEENLYTIPLLDLDFPEINPKVETELTFKAEQKDIRKAIKLSKVLWDKSSSAFSSNRNKITLKATKDNEFIAEAFTEKGSFRRKIKFKYNINTIGKDISSAFDWEMLDNMTRGVQSDYSDGDSESGQITIQLGNNKALVIEGNYGGTKLKTFVCCLMDSHEEEPEFEAEEEPEEPPEEVTAKATA